MRARRLGGGSGWRVLGLGGGVAIVTSLPDHLEDPLRTMRSRQPTTPIRQKSRDGTSPRRPRSRTRPSSAGRTSPRPRPHDPRTRAGSAARSPWRPRPVAPTAGHARTETGPRTSPPETTVDDALPRTRTRCPAPADPRPPTPHRATHADLANDPAQPNDPSGNRATPRARLVRNIPSITRLSSKCGEVWP